MSTTHTSRTRQGRAGLKILVVTIAVVGLGAGGVWLASASGALGSSSQSHDTAELAVATITDFQISVTASGDLAAKNSIEIKNPVETRTTIVELVPEGTIVSAGDLLVQLNTDEIDSRLRDEDLQVIGAQNNLAAAESSLKIQISQNASSLTDATLKVELAKLALERWRKGEVARQREQQRIAVEKAKRELDRLTRKVARSQELFNKDFLSSDELERDQIALAQAVADEKIATLNQQIYEQYQYPEDEKTKISDVKKAQDALERTIEQNAINAKLKQAEVDTRKLQLQRRQENLNKLKEQLEAATITAPADGLVVYATTLQQSRGGFSFGEGALAVGREVRPHEGLISLPDTSEMVAQVRVPESIAGRIRAGQHALVEIEAIGRTLMGTVDNVGVMAESGGWRDPNRREYTVKIALDAGDADGQLKPSMRCDATIILGEVSGALAVPIQAVFSDGPVQFVYTPRNGRYERTPVKMGRRSDTYAQILAGIEEGDRVLIRDPDPAEVIAGDWDEQALLDAGYMINDEGQPVLASPRMDRAAMMKMISEKTKSGDSSMVIKGGNLPEGTTIDPSKLKAMGSTPPADKTTGRPTDTAGTGAPAGKQRGTRPARKKD